MIPVDFKKAALNLAHRLDAIRMGAFVTWHNQTASGAVVLKMPVYDEIASEWIEFLTPFGLGRQSDAYEAVARRGWDNADLIASADWEETVHIASSIARAQRTTKGDILARAQEKRMLSGVLIRLAYLADTPDGRGHLSHAGRLFSAPDAS